MQRSPSRAPFLAAAVLLAGACASTESSPSSEAGWKSLFDGKSLAGWTEHGGHYDGDADWTVEDGAITGREAAGHVGGLLYTADAYSDFEFQCDCKCDWPFDSGIFLRMQKELRGAQVTIDFRPDGEMCAIYSDGYLLHNPSTMSKFVKDKWNHFDVSCTGRDMHIVTKLNGETVVDFTIPTSADFAREGLIGIQVHGGSDSPAGQKVQFKNLRVRDLSARTANAKAK
jgi:hypothetical protein